MTKTKTKQHLTPEEGQDLDRAILRKRKALAMARKNDKLTAQRDALLAACKGLTEATKSYWVLPQIKPFYDAARAAIAQAEGKP